MGARGKTPPLSLSNKPGFYKTAARAPYHQDIVESLLKFYGTRFYAKYERLLRSRALVRKTAALGSIGLAVEMPPANPFFMYQF